VGFVPKVKIEVVTDLFDTEHLMEVIAQAARTGKIGDGKIWVTEVEHIARIRTGELDEDAV
jgi:nitrogen regulatory protein P-II 1